MDRNCPVSPNAFERRRSQELLVSVDFACRLDRIRLAEALEEALFSAMYHGNLGISKRELAQAKCRTDGHLERLITSWLRQPHVRGRRIFVGVRVSPNTIRFVIRDEGQVGDPTTATRVVPDSSSGRGEDRGLTLVQSIMDEVEFDRNELRMSRQTRRTPSVS